MMERNYNISEILRVANYFFGVDVCKKTRKMEYVKPRQIAHYVAHKVFRHSQSSVGKWIGGKDHATVLYSCSVIEGEIYIYPEVRDQVERFILSIKLLCNNSFLNKNN